MDKRQTMMLTNSPPEAANMWVKAGLEPNVAECFGKFTFKFS